MNKLAVLEGILFVVGDEGITLEKICEVLECKPGDILDYEKHFDIDKKIRDSLCVLKGYGLIDCEKTVFNNNYGTKIDALY